MDNYSTKKQSETRKEQGNSVNNLYSNSNY